MSKKILITGATDGIGFAAAKKLTAMGHEVLIHGRSKAKIEKVVSELNGAQSYQCDLSSTSEIKKFMEAVKADHEKIDILINNAGVLKTSQPITSDSLDIRFMVNTIAPYFLTKGLLSTISSGGRVLNLSSAAQSPVSLKALKGEEELSELEAYAQSKLAITMWSYYMSQQLNDGPIFMALNPGSLLGSKMVREGFGVEGKDISIGADIIIKLSLSDEFKNCSGKYFDNDAGNLADPHIDGMNIIKVEEVVNTIESIIKDKFSS